MRPSWSQGMGRPIAPLVEPCPLGHPSAAGWVSAPAPRSMTGPTREVRGPEQGRARVSLPGFLST